MYVCMLLVCVVCVQGMYGVVICVCGVCSWIVCV